MLHQNGAKINHHQLLNGKAILDADTPATRPPNGAEDKTSKALEYCQFNRKNDNKPKRKSATWSELTARLKVHGVRAKKDGPLWSPAIYPEGKTRADENVIAISALVADIDHDGEARYEGIIKRLAPYAFAIYSTFSHTLENNRYRVVVELSATVAAADWPDFWQRANYWLFEGGLDPNTKDLCRFYYLPAHAPGGLHFAWSHEGEPLDPAALPEAPTTSRSNGRGPMAGPTESAQRVPLGQKAKDFALFGAPYYQQRAAALAAARNCCSAGLPVEEAVRLIWQGFQASKQDTANPWTEGDAEAIAEDIYAKPPSKTLEPLAPSGNVYLHGRLISGPALSAPRPKRPLTETGNAERLVDIFGEDILYCYEWDKWLVWDDTRWVIDSGAAIDQLAKAVARAIYSEAGREEDDEKRKAIVGWAKVSESIRARANMLRGAQSEQNIPITPADLDADIWLLNAENGTIDLRTKLIRGHRREDLITKIIPIAYDPQAPHPIFDRFLSEVQPEEDNRRYLKRWAGYSATGSTKEERLSIWHGSGANGKTTLARAIQDTLGPYAKQIDPDILMVQKNGQHPTGKADLFGARAVFASETGDGQVLAEKLVKSLSSRDKIKARFLYQNDFEWVPTHSLAILTNHKPEIQGTDNGIWRRIDLLPWTVTIPDEQKDLDLLDKLATEAAGILAYIVEGAADWYANGLTRPAAIVEATAAYREQADIIGPFLSDCCVIDRKARVSVRDLYTEYQTWALTNGEEPTDKKDFVKRLSERGFNTKRGRGGVRFWGGIGLSITPPLPEEDEKGDSGDSGDAVSTNLSKSFSHVESLGKTESPASPESPTTANLEGGEL